MTGGITDAAARLGVALADRYRIDREPGAGGMATVYLAHDLKHDRDVAIKMLRPELGAVLGGERFLAEIRTTARLQHPHILPLLDSGDADGLRWMSVTPPSKLGAVPGVAKFLFTGPYLNVLGRSHDIAPDGRHLLIARPKDVTTTTLTIVTNWVSRLPRSEAKR